MPFSTASAFQPDGYHAYMMRLWRAGSDDTWRVSLHCVQTGEKLHFPGLASLYAYLHAQTSAGTANDEKPSIADLLTLFDALVEQLTHDERAGELAHISAWLQAQLGDS